MTDLQRVEIMLSGSESYCSYLNRYHILLAKNLSHQVLGTGYRGMLVIDYQTDKTPGALYPIVLDNQMPNALDDPVTHGLNTTGSGL